MNFIPVNTPKLHSLEKKYVNECIKTNWFSSEGKFVKLFEKNFSSLNKRKFGVAVSNGTAALEVAVKSLNLKKNSEVLIPSFSIISTANAVIKNNLKPVLIDCDLDTWNINIEETIKKITNKTKAIIITHIYGLPVDLDKILKIAKIRNIKIIEDAAEVIGLKYKNKICGSFGDLSIFSFYANKHITTGEGGAILTNSLQLDNKIKSLRNLCFGKINRYNHTEIGWNYRFTNIQAALGLNQIKRIKSIIRKKISVGKQYYKYLKNNKNIYIQKPKLDNIQNVYWVVGILIKNKKILAQNLQKKLKKFGIETRSFFWPMNKQIITKKLKLKFNKKYQNSEYLSKYGFYLPSGINMKNKQIKMICERLNKLI